MEKDKTFLQPSSHGLLNNNKGASEYSLCVCTGLVYNTKSNIEQIFNIL